MGRMCREDMRESGDNNEGMRKVGVEPGQRKRAVPFNHPISADLRSSGRG